MHASAHRPVRVTLALALATLLAVAALPLLSTSASAQTSPGRYVLSAKETRKALFVEQFRLSYEGWERLQKVFELEMAAVAYGVAPQPNVDTQPAAADFAKIVGEVRAAENAAMASRLEKAVDVEARQRFLWDVIDNAAPGLSGQARGVAAVAIANLSKRSAAATASLRAVDPLGVPTDADILTGRSSYLDRVESAVVDATLGPAFDRANAPTGVRLAESIKTLVPRVPFPVTASKAEMVSSSADLQAIDVIAALRPPSASQTPAKSVSIEEGLSGTPDQVRELADVEMGKATQAAEEAVTTAKGFWATAKKMADYYGSEADKEADRKAGEAWEKKWGSEMKLAKAAVGILGKVAGDFDPALASDIVEVGGALIKGTQAIGKFMESIPKGTGFFQALFTTSGFGMIGELSGVVSTILGAFRGGSSAESVLGAIGKLRAAVAQLRTEMHQRFDRVDAKLDQIFGTLLEAWQSLNTQLGTIDGSLDVLRQKLRDAETRVSRAESNIWGFIRDAATLDLRTKVNTYLHYKEQSGLDLPYDKFYELEGAFYTVSANTSTTATGPLPKDRSIDDGKVLEELTTYPLDANLGWLDRYVTERWGLPRISDVPPPNPTDWAFAARAYEQLGRDWPAHLARVNTNWMQSMRGLGSELQSTSRKLVAKNGSGAHVYFDRAAVNYRQKLDSLLTSLAGADAVGVTENQPVGIDLWAGPTQTIPAEQRPLTPGTMGPCSTPPGHPMATLNSPNNLSPTDMFPPEALVAAKLGLAQLGVCYSVRWTDVKTLECNTNNPCTSTQGASYNAGPMSRSPLSVAVRATYKVADGPAVTLRERALVVPGETWSNNAIVFPITTTTTTCQSQPQPLPFPPRCPPTPPTRTEASGLWCGKGTESPPCSQIAWFVPGFEGLLHPSTRPFAEQWQAYDNIRQKFEAGAGPAVDVGPPGALTPAVTAELQRRQRKVYLRLADSLSDPTHPLYQSVIDPAVRLAGSTRLIDTLVSVALSRPLQTDEILQGILRGEDRLLDNDADQRVRLFLLRYGTSCGGTLEPPNCVADADLPSHNVRTDLAGIGTSRVDALVALLGTYWAQADGGVDISANDSVAATLARLAEVDAMAHDRLIAVDTASMSYAPTRVGTAVTGKVTLQNPSPGTTVGITSVSVTGASAGEFSAQSGCRTTLAPGASCTVDVRYAPRGTGAHAATLSVASNAVGGSVQIPLQGTGDVAVPPSLYVNDTSVVEGDSGARNTNFRVSLSTASLDTVTVDAATSDGTAVGGSDYTGLAPATLRFAPGETTKSVAVPVIGDTRREGNETFALKLSNPQKAVVGDDQGTATVVDEEGLAAVYVADTSIGEGNSGTRVVTFNLSLSGPAPEAVTVKTETSDGTASAGSDYVGLASTTVSFAACEVSKAVKVTVKGDTNSEPNESFALKLSAPSKNAVLADAAGTATITNDDATPGPAVLPSLYVKDAISLEGDAGARKATFRVSLSRSSTDTVTVKAETANGTGTAGSDYAAVAPTTLSFAPGETAKNLDVALTGDTRPEVDETVLLKLSSPQKAVLGDDQGTATIVDEEGLTRIFVGDPSVIEGNSGTRNAVFTVSLSIPAGDIVTVKTATADGSATAGSDYARRSASTLSFAPGETTKQVAVTINGDTSREPNESFTLVASTPSASAVIADAAGTGIIVNDD